ncbi:hypothetical protein ELI01_18630 [Rhizobium leguminosarum]|uniref:hypothetical protein n=1 Tax=Rhizobium leguminosarum TaxID=384 RepID=UPI00102F70E9|nr:hypothetical protein [Rhizobium leguminosarum]TAX57098.1 hypothetical protein ELI01_18630 [Rhizobium leguminosarum]
MKSQLEMESQYIAVASSNLVSPCLSEHWEQMRVRKFLDQHKIAISFKWRSVTYGYYASHEETNEAWAEVLRSEGYVPPKWWQVSRWDEKRAPKEVLQILAAKEPSNV